MAGDNPQQAAAGQPSCEQALSAAEQHGGAAAADARAQRCDNLALGRIAEEAAPAAAAPAKKRSRVAQPGARPGARQKERSVQELHFAEVKEEECPAPTGPVPSGAGTVEDGGHKRKRSEAERQQEHGAEIVGCSVWVRWEDTLKWYKGKVVSYDSGSGKHTVRYEDDEELQYVLSECDYYLDDSPTTSAAAGPSLAPRAAGAAAGMPTPSEQLQQSARPLLSGWSRAPQGGAWRICPAFYANHKLLQLSAKGLATLGITHGSGPSQLTLVDQAKGLRGEFKVTYNPSGTCSLKGCAVFEELGIREGRVLWLGPLEGSALPFSCEDSQGGGPQAARQQAAGAQAAQPGGGPSAATRRAAAAATSGAVAVVADSMAPAVTADGPRAPELTPDGSGALGADAGGHAAPPGRATRGASQGGPSASRAGGSGHVVGPKGHLKRGLRYVRMVPPPGGSPPVAYGPGSKRNARDWFLHSDNSLSFRLRAADLDARSLQLKWVVAERLGIAHAQPLRMVERGGGRGWDCEVAGDGGARCYTIQRQFGRLLWEKEAQEGDELRFWPASAPAPGRVLEMEFSLGDAAAAAQAVIPPLVRSQPCPSEQGTAEEQAQHGTPAGAPPAATAVTPAQKRPRVEMPAIPAHLPVQPAQQQQQQQQGGSGSGSLGLFGSPRLAGAPTPSPRAGRTAGQQAQQHAPAAAAAPAAADPSDPWAMLEELHRGPLAQAGLSKEDLTEFDLAWMVMSPGRCRSAHSAVQRAAAAGNWAAVRQAVLAAMAAVEDGTGDSGGDGDDPHAMLGALQQALEDAGVEAGALTAFECAFLEATAEGWLCIHRAVLRAAALPAPEATCLVQRLAVAAVASLQELQAGASGGSGPHATLCALQELLGDEVEPGQLARLEAAWLAPPSVRWRDSIERMVRRAHEQGPGALRQVVAAVVRISG